jgi:hypothetical protein
MAESTGRKQDWEAPTLTELGDIETLTASTPPTSAGDGLGFTS